MADSLPVRLRTQTGNVRPPLFFPLCVSLRSLRESIPPSSPFESFVLFVVNPSSFLIARPVAPMPLLHFKIAAVLLEGISGTPH